MSEVETYFKDPETINVAELHIKFDLGLELSPRLIDEAVLHARFDFLDEELSEMLLAIEEGDFAGIIDALVDMVVVAKGTAIMMGVEWKPHWDEVHRANLAKKRGFNPKRPDMPADMIKPEGWIPPNHEKILERHDW